MLERPVAPLLFKFALPILIGMIASVGFQLADTYFVGRLGTESLAALGFIFPVAFAFTLFGTGLDIGTMVTVSKLIGAGDKDAAGKLVFDTMLLGLLLSLVLMLGGLSSIQPMFRALGATEALMQPISGYMVVWYAALPLQIVPIVMGGAMRAAGNAKHPGMLITLSALLNAALDPLLIFGLGPIPGFGVQGAAIASVIARVGYTGALGYLLVRHQKLVGLRHMRAAGILQSWRTNLAISLPASVNNALMPLTALYTTTIVAQHGPEAVAAVGAGNRLESVSFIFSLVTGIALGPFIGQNLGARQLDRVRHGLNLGWKVAIGVGAFFFVVVQLGSTTFAGVFSDDPRVVNVVDSYLSTVSLTYAFQGFMVIGSMALSTMGRPLLATSITAVRQILFYAPLTWFLNQRYGIDGVFYSMVLTNAIFGLVVVFAVRSTLRGLATAPVAADG